MTSWMSFGQKKLKIFNIDYILKMVYEETKDPVTGKEISRLNVDPNSLAPKWAITIYLILIFLIVCLGLSINASVELQNLENDVERIEEINFVDNVTGDENIIVTRTGACVNVGLSPQITDIVSITSRETEPYLTVLSGLCVRNNFITGQDSNAIFLGTDASVIGGFGNTIIGNATANASVIGGNTNKIDGFGGGDNSFIGGGNNNEIFANTGHHNSFIGGGERNGITGTAGHSFIGGGQDNKIKDTSWNSFIGSGEDNKIQSGSSYSATLGGDNNIIDNSSHSSILGGENNGITGSDHSSIGGGITGEINNSVYSFIGGGQNNGITGANHSFIGGGESNGITGSDHSAILGGRDNNIQIIDNGFTSILGGESNNITGSDHSVILGGRDNIIRNNENGFTSIVGGQNNGITGSDHSAILGGRDNNIRDNSNGFTSIVGGQNNGITGSDHSFIGGGSVNRINNSNHSGINSGGGNFIRNLCNFSFIGGGQNSGITGSSNHSFIGGGFVNTIDNSNYSGFIGGQNNGITGSSHSFIGGGQSNGITGGITGSDHSAILCGQNNNVINCPRSAVIGSRDSTMQNCDTTVFLSGDGLSCTPTVPGTSYYNCVLMGKYNDFSGTENIFSLTPPPSTGTPDKISLIIGNGTIGNRVNVFQVDDRGNVYLGDNTYPGASIYHYDAGNYVAKSFTIQHPEKEENWLMHGCLEGPEGGVYYRGKDTAPTEVRLPSYAPKIAKDFTVNVTPIGDPRMMSVSEVSEEGVFKVNGEGKFFWTAMGERVKMDPEPRKTDVVVKNVGPYTWLE